MLVVQIDMWPFGDSSLARSISTLYINNTGKQISSGVFEYKYNIGSSEEFTLHDRGDCAEILVARCLNDAIEKGIVSKW